MSNNQLIWPITLLGVIVMVISGIILLVNPDTGATLVVGFLAGAAFFVTSIVGLKQTAETKAAVIEAREQGLQNAHELKAVTFEGKAVSEQNAQEINKIHQMLNSERSEMKDEIRAQSRDILDLKLAIRDLHAMLKEKQAVIVEQAATIAAQPIMEGS